MFKALLKLRQACCHPCIGSGGIGGGGGSRLGSGGMGVGHGTGAGQGRWLTMDQILDRCERRICNVCSQDRMTLEGVALTATLCVFIFRI